MKSVLVAILSLAIFVTGGAVLAQGTTSPGQEKLDKILVTTNESHRQAGIATILLVGRPDGTTMGDLFDPAARTRLHDAAVEALVVLDAIGPSPCYAEWFDVTRMGFWLVEKVSGDLDAKDLATDQQDNETRDKATEDLNFAVVGFDLLDYSDVLLKDVQCIPVVTPAPPSAKSTTTPIPVLTPTPEQTQKPRASSTPKPSPTSSPS